MKAYISPFPREKSNNEVLKKSYARKVEGKKSAMATTIIDIPPSVTMSYMKKNPFYFDLKKSNRLRNKGSSYKRPKTSTTRYNTTTNSGQYTLYDKEKLETLLKSGTENFIVPKPKLKPEREIIKPKMQQKLLSEEERKKLTPKDILNIINKIKIPLEDKNIGKVPNYINEFRIRNFIEKEYERLVEEEKNFPRGTFKVYDGDRIQILHKLNIVKKELTEQLNKFPVTYNLRSIGIKNKRALIEKRLEEIDYAIKIFSLSDVFLKK